MQCPRNYGELTVGPLSWENAAPLRYAASQSEGHVRAYDLPAAVSADPSLALPADLIRARGKEFGIRNPEFPSEYCALPIPQHSLLIDGAGQRIGYSRRRQRRILCNSAIVVAAVLDFPAFALCVR